MKLFNFIWQYQPICGPKICSAIILISVPNFPHKKKSNLRKMVQLGIVWKGDHMLFEEIKLRKRINLKVMEGEIKNEFFYYICYSSAEWKRDGEWLIKAKLIKHTGWPKSPFPLIFY